MLVIVGLCGCQSDEPQPAELEDPIAIHIQELLEEEVMGYSYVILRDGEIAAEEGFGRARNELDGNIAMESTTPMHVASISKFFTTVTTLKLLEKTGISADSSVVAFLPSDWVIGPGIDRLSFKHIISQTGGFNHYGTQGFTANRYDSLKFIVEEGAERAKLKFYSNSHHSLLRVILPVMDDLTNNIEGVYDENSVGFKYESLVDTYLFDPINVEAALGASSLEVAMAYSGPEDSGSGLGANTFFTPVAGAYGWHLSAQDLGILWSKVWYSEDLISADSRDLMKATTAGLFDSFQGNYGFYFIKTGSWTYGNSPTRRIQTTAIHFPDNVDVILFVNSPPSRSFGPTGIAVQAYEMSQAALP